MGNDVEAVPEAAKECQAGLRGPWIVLQADSEVSVCVAGPLKVDDLGHSVLGGVQTQGGEVEPHLQGPERHAV